MKFSTLQTIERLLRSETELKKRIKNEAWNSYSDKVDKCRAAGVKESNIKAHLAEEFATYEHFRDEYDALYDAYQDFIGTDFHS